MNFGAENLLVKKRFSKRFAKKAIRKMNLALWPSEILRFIVLGLIRFYQRSISPLTPPSCFFYPTCSHYTYQAIERFGVLRGGWLGVHRVCRCHPLTRGGYDPVPEKWRFWPSRIQEQEAVSQNQESQQAPATNVDHKLNDVAVSDGLRDLDE